MSWDTGAGKRTSYSSLAMIVGLVSVCQVSLGLRDVVSRARVCRARKLKQINQWRLLDKGTGSMVVQLGKSIDDVVLPAMYGLFQRGPGRPRQLRSFLL